MSLQLFSCQCANKTAHSKDEQLLPLWSEAATLSFSKLSHQLKIRLHLIQSQQGWWLVLCRIITSTVHLTSPCPEEPADITKHQFWLNLISVQVTICGHSGCFSAEALLSRCNFFDMYRKSFTSIHTTKADMAGITKMLSVPRRGFTYTRMHLHSALINQYKIKFILVAGLVLKPLVQQYIAGIKLRRFIPLNKDWKIDFSMFN